MTNWFEENKILKVKLGAAVTTVSGKDMNLRLWRLESHQHN